MPEFIPVHTISLGCPKNLVDTERILGALGNRFRPVETPEEAEVVLINTCGFIQPAVEESIQTILEVAGDAAERSPRPLVAVTGCMLARYGAEMERELPEVDVWVPLDRQHEAGDYLLRALGREVPTGERSKAQNADAVPERVISTGASYAYLKISEGCDRSCSFCLIPDIRGGMRSRSIESLKEEGRSLLERGVRELIVVGQDVTRYGRDLGPGRDLPALLRELASLPGLAWLRLMYLYPSGIDVRLLTSLRELMPPLLPYFDIPLQHAHPDILKAMGRPFATQPDRVVDLVRSHFPEASLRTTLLTGFPGEGEEHFRTLADFVRRKRFQHMGVFAFWAEEGVRAAEFPGQVDEEVKEARRSELMRIQAEISGEQLEACQGEEMTVLVDRPNPEWPTLYEGRVWFQAPEVDGICYVSGESLSPGDMVTARIEETRTYDLVALA
jgi:tRNA-2-methylthio-N6-dimethylallyladenosine synthase/ribosomal protein S12 methylthiotransferase